MTVLPVLAVGILMNLVAVLFVLVSVVLILLILIQKGRGGGLSAAFGGGMASGLLGSKTGDFLTWATITVVGVFLVLAVVLAKFYKPGVGEYTGAAPGRHSRPPRAHRPSRPARLRSLHRRSRRPRNSPARQPPWAHSPRALRRPRPRKPIRQAAKGWRIAWLWQTGFPQDRFLYGGSFGFESALLCSIA